MHKRCSEALSTLMRFRCHRTRASINSRSHYCFDVFSTVHTRTLEIDRIARCDVSWTLCACYKHTRLRYFRSPFSFSCVFVRPHWYDMYAFSFWSTFKSVFSVHFQRFLSALVRTKGLNSSKCMRFQTKHVSVDGAWLWRFSQCRTDLCIKQFLDI